MNKVISERSLAGGNVRLRHHPSQKQTLEQRVGRPPVARPVTAEAIVETRVISIGWIVLHKRYQNQQLRNVAGRQQREKGQRRGQQASVFSVGTLVPLPAR